LGSGVRRMPAPGFFLTGVTKSHAEERLDGCPSTTFTQRVKPFLKCRK
jgi:hypothetical protein